MVKFIRCMRRREDVSPDAFRRAWQDPAYREMLGALSATGEAQRCVMDLTLRISANAQLMAGGGANPFDGVMEFWFGEPTALGRALNSDEVKAVGDELRAYEACFIDVANSTEFIVECEDVYTK